MMNRKTVALLSLLLVSSVGGCVAPGLLPIATFTPTPLSGESPLIVTFDASGSQAPNGTIVEYGWDFGDGTAGTGMSIAHSFQTDVDHTFTVTLRVTDHLGQQATATAAISVSPATGIEEHPSVEFVWPFHYDASGDDALNLNDEYFTLQNTGAGPVDLSGWTVGNERGATFRFPNGTVLAPHAVLYVHSGAGSNTAGILYWNATEPIWNDKSDAAILQDADGTIIDLYPYYAC